MFYIVNAMMCEMLLQIPHHHFDSWVLCFLPVAGPLESDPEYRLIVAANNLTVEIDNELSESPAPASSNLLKRL